MNTTHVPEARIERVQQHRSTENVAAASIASSVTRRLFATDASWPLFVLRLVLAAVMFAHGAQKAWGLFGGYGFGGTMGFFTDTLGIPYALGVLVIIVETAGAVALAVGFMGRIMAAGMGAIMVVAVATIHGANGFYMNWSGQQAGEGFELHLLAAGIALALLIGGSGILSIDRAIAKRLPR